MKKLMLTTIGIIGVSMAAALVVSKGIYKLAKDECEEFEVEATDEK
jgi:hypothetical protein